jgi:class 3 adenylate cyclase
VRLTADQGIRLAVRLGIHTGLVVVGEMGSGGRAGSPCQLRWCSRSSPRPTGCRCLSKS